MLQLFSIISRLPEHAYVRCVRKADPFRWNSVTGSTIIDQSYICLHCSREIPGTTLLVGNRVIYSMTAYYFKREIKTILLSLSHFFLFQFYVNYKEEYYSIICMTLRATSMPPITFDIVCTNSTGSILCPTAHMHYAYHNLFLFYENTKTKRSVRFVCLCNCVCNINSE